MTLTTRAGKGSVLTHDEMDENLRHLNYFYRGGSALSTISKDTKLGEFVSITDWGGTGNGSTDNTNAFNNAIADLPTGGGTLFFPPGRYIFNSRPNPIPKGITLRGLGGSGASAYGAYLVRAYSAASATEAFLHWDGSGDTNQHTGGGLENMTILAGSSSHTGGTGVKISGSSLSQRPGWMYFENAKILSTVGSCSWAHALYADGSSLSDASAQGLRDFVWVGCTFAGATENDETVKLLNAYLWHFNSCTVLDGTGGGGSPGMKITGTNGTSTNKSINVYLSGICINGLLTVENANLVHGTGFAQNITAGTNATNCMFDGLVSGTITDSSSAGSVAIIRQLATEYQIIARKTRIKGPDGLIPFAVGIDTGDVFQVAPNSAGGGVDIRATNNGETDYEPVQITGETIALRYRTGVGTNANAALVDTSGQLNLYKRMFPATDAGAAQTACGVFAGSGAPNNANGQNGDYYLRSDGTAAGNTCIYHREGGSWVALVTS